MSLINNRLLFSIVLLLSVPAFAGEYFHVNIPEWLNNEDSIAVSVVGVDDPVWNSVIYKQEERVPGFFVRYSVCNVHRGNVQSCKEISRTPVKKVNDNDEVVLNEFIKISVKELKEKSKDLIQVGDLALKIQLIYDGKYDLMSKVLEHFNFYGFSGSVAEEVIALDSLHQNALNQWSSHPGMSPRAHLKAKYVPAAAAPSLSQETAPRRATIEQ